MRSNRTGGWAAAFTALALAGILAGCGMSAGTKPNAGGPTQSMKSSGAGTPNKSGLYNAGKRTAKKTGNMAGNAAQYASKSGSLGKHGGKSSGQIANNLSGAARKTGKKMGSSASAAKNSMNHMASMGGSKNGGSKTTGSAKMSASRSGSANSGAKRSGTKGSKGGSAASKSGAGKSTSMGANRRRPGTSWILASSAVKPMSLSTLPPLTYVQKLNPWLKHAHQVSTFITNMGYHWAAPYPGLVLMTNQAGAVTAVEAAFPQKLGQYSWWDPPTTVPNGGVAYNSEHLYFVAPTSITPTMTTTTSDLTSWSAFQAVNTRLSSYVKEPAAFMGLSVYGPPTGPGIKVLVSTSGTVSGFLVEEPATWGHFPGYYPARKKGPLPSKEFGKAYDSVVLLAPVKSGATP